MRNAASSLSMRTSGSAAAIQEALLYGSFSQYARHFYALLRYHLRCRVCFTSKPFTSMANSSARIVTLCLSSASGQRKRPFSSRFAHTHSPLPSHTSAFKRVRVRLENRNRCPLSGSAPNGRRIESSWNFITADLDKLIRVVEG